jgi:FkbM family methyltransferase
MIYRLLHRSKTFLLLIFRGTLIKVLKEKRLKKVFLKAKELNKPSILIRYNGIKLNLNIKSKFSEILVHGPFELEEQCFLKYFLKRNGVFIDVGSNIGLFSLIASKRVGKKGKVYSFEPTPETFKWLQLNISVNRIKNIYASNIAVSNNSGKQEFKISGDGYDAWNSFGIPSEGKVIEKIQVNTITFDDFICLNNLERIDLIKIDVEGWEINVLKGGKKYFNKCTSAAILIEFTDINLQNAGFSSTELYNLLISYGYKLFTFNCSQKLLLKDNLREEYPYLNLVALKQFHLDKLGIK